MNPQLEKYRAEKKRIERELEQCRHRDTLLKNRITYLEQGERKKRAHRLITRGAAVESIAPSIKHMSETEFYELMETILTDPAIVPLLPKADGDG